MAHLKKLTTGVLPCRREDVPFKEFGPTDGMLLDLESGEYYGLEGAAVAVWKQLDGRTAVEDVSQRLAERHGVDPETVSREVASFLRRLRTSGLLAEPGAVETASQMAEPRGKRRRTAPKGTPYLPPRLTKRGNLKFLGQLD